MIRRLMRLEEEGVSVILWERWWMVNKLLRMDL